MFELEFLKNIIIYLLYPNNRYTLILFMGSILAPLESISQMEFKIRGIMFMACVWGQGVFQ
jgi:hypothetical protein